MDGILCIVLYILNYIYDIRLDYSYFPPPLEMEMEKDGPLERREERRGEREEVLFCFLFFFLERAFHASFGVLEPGISRMNQAHL